MDAYRARTIARFSGLALLVVFAVVLALMQRSLVRMKAEKKGVLPVAEVPGSGVAVGTQAGTAARELLGRNASIRAVMDFEHDGATESVVVVAAAGTPPRETWATRVGVIGRSSTGRFALLFDSSRSTDLPPHPDEVARWRVLSLDRGHLDLEPIGPAGEARGPIHRVELDARTGHLHAVEMPKAPSASPPPAVEAASPGVEAAPSPAFEAPPSPAVEAASPTPE